MGMIGTTELLVILGVVVLLFGAKKLPALGGAIGESIRNFKKGVSDIDSKNENMDQKKNDTDRIE